MLLTYLISGHGLSHRDLSHGDAQDRGDARPLISFITTMPEPSKAAIAVPSKDPKKKEKDEKDGAASKKKPDEKEGEELVSYI